MKTILTDRPLFEDGIKDIVVKKIELGELNKFDGDTSIIAVVGSRAMAINCANMNLPALKLFQLTSAGFDGVPTENFAQKGVVVANAGTVYSVPIAETVVFGILQMAKKLRKNPNNRRFKLTRGYKEISELQDKKVLIMGAGNIGTAIASRLASFDMIIEGYDLYCKEKPEYTKILRTKEELLKNLKLYDYIVSTLPDNKETNGFINKELFTEMKNTAVIINVGRKAVFNNDDFYNALKGRKIGGAVLDMFEKIPNPITNKFRRLRNTIILPGVAAISQEVGPRLKTYIENNIFALVENREISNVINGVK